MVRIKVIKADITKQETEAIVNAANNSLLGGGGVDGAIHRAAGPELLAYNRKLNGCKTGEAKISPGFNLKAKYIIHTVGPVWNGGNNDEDKLLANCYKSCFRLVVENKIKSISLPAISTGIYGFPLERAVAIAIAETREYMRHDDSIEEIVFVCFDDRTFNAYLKAIKNENIF